MTSPRLPGFSPRASLRHDGPYDLASTEEPEPAAESDENVLAAAPEPAAPTAAPAPAAPTPKLPLLRVFKVQQEAEPKRCTGGTG